MPQHPEPAGPPTDGPSPSALRRLREDHSERVLALLRQHGPLSRSDLSEHSGLSRTTLSGITAELSERGLLAVEPAPGPAADRPRRRGRPTSRLTLNPATGQYVGVELGRSRLRVVIADASHTVRARSDTAFGPARSAAARRELAERRVRQLAAEHGIALGSLAGVGAGTPGPGEYTAVTPGGRPSENTPAHTPDGQHTAGADARRGRPAVARALADAFDAPCCADNNTRLTALAEATWGAGTGASDLLYVHLSYGVGGGLVLGGQLVRGRAGVAAEIGHLPVDPAGPACWCGARGCLELSASVPAVLRAAGHAPHQRGWDALCAALEAGGRRETRAVRAAALDTGAALAALCAAVHPGPIVLGGELAQLGPVFLDTVRESFEDRAMRAVRRTAQLRAATLDPWGGALGGMALALRESPMLARYPLPPRGDAGPVSAPPPTAPGSGPGPGPDPGSGPAPAARTAAPG